MTAPMLTQSTAAGVRRIEAHTPAGLVATAYGAGPGWVVIAEPVEVADEIDARATLAALAGMIGELQRGRRGGGVSSYVLRFQLEGSMTIDADSAERAEKCAIEALQCVDAMDAEAFNPDGCTVHLRWREADELERLDRSPICTEFAS